MPAAAVFDSVGDSPDAMSCDWLAPVALGDGRGDDASH